MIYRAIKWVVVQFARLFGWTTNAEPQGWAPGEQETLLKEAKAYGTDVRFVVVACLAKFAKIDGVVTKNELVHVEEAFDALELTKEQRQQAIKTFNYAKQGKATLRACVQFFAEVEQHDAQWMIILMLMFFRVAHADGAPNAPTQQALEEICAWVGVDYQECAKIHAETRHETPPPLDEADLGAAYTVLGCQPTDAPGIIKDRYRKLVKDFHPDTVMSKGLPADFVKFAEERFKQIQAAYEMVMAARGSKTA